MSGVTAIDLLSFAATGDGEAVRVSWQTAQESENKGFNLYRGTSPAGPFEKLNGGLIPSGSVSGEGRSYEFVDTAVSRGTLYYYKLEDVDVSGTVTPHGPVCVDWDGDGIPDDWEIAYGLNPGVNDANLDSDGDGVPNWLEYQRGTDPFNADTDGDGIADGAEKKNPGYSGGSVSSLERGCECAGARLRQPWDDARAGDEELRRDAGDGGRSGLRAAAGAGLRARLYTGAGAAAGAAKRDPAGDPARQTGAGRGAGCASRVLAGYRVYPAPLHQAGANNQVAEVFSWDEAAYRSNAYYPAVAAELSTEYVFRGQAQQRLIFYPLRFNPGTGELLHYERLRVRVEFVEPPPPPTKAPAAQRGRSQAQRALPQLPPAATRLVDPGGGGLQGEHQRGGDLPDHAGLGFRPPALPMRTSMRSICPRCSCSTWGRSRRFHVYDANSNNRLDAGDSITLIRRGRTRGVCEVRQVQRVLADRCGQRQPPADEFH